MKKILIFIAIGISILVCAKNSKDDTVIIPNNSLRFRVVSNSNNQQDLMLKLKLKSVVEKYVYDILKTAKTVDEATDIINTNIEEIRAIVKSNLGDNDYELVFGKNYFPKKLYKGVIYESGYYDSLVITLGKGTGDNWWCVLFPPLCLLEDNVNTNDVEYRYFITRIIDQFK